MYALSSPSFSPEDSPKEGWVEKCKKMMDTTLCQDVKKYERLTKIGQGTYGEVFKARHRATQKFVALKRILMSNVDEGFPVTFLKEIEILKLIQHKNVVNFIEICYSEEIDYSKTTYFLVLDFCQHDLAGLLKSKIQFSLGEIKMVMKQLLEGLHYLHQNQFLHRDIKTANILMTKEGILKIADFGLARPFSKNAKHNRFTQKVVTLWYRAPELLLGDRNYGPAIDMWSTGLIMAEMWKRDPVLKGNCDQEQLKMIIQLCGCINSYSFPGVEKLELYKSLKINKGQERKVKERLQAFVKDPNALDLIDKLLIIDPAKRFDCESALNHNCFSEYPMPCDLRKTLSNIKQSKFDYTHTKNQKDEERAEQPVQYYYRNYDQYADVEF